MVWHFIGVCMKVNTLCCKIFYSFAVLTRKILCNTQREISYLHTTMQYTQLQHSFPLVLFVLKYFTNQICAFS